MQTVKKRKAKRKVKLPIHIYLLYMIIATLVFTAVTFSSYVSTSEGGDSVKVALFANDAEVLIPLNECYPGCDPIEVPITVTNYDDDKVCEVSQSYSITVQNVFNAIPLKFDWSETPVGNFHLGDGRKQTKQYTLTISWPVDGGYPSSELADEIDVVRILVNCDQID